MAKKRCLACPRRKYCSDDCYHAIADCNCDFAVKFDSMSRKISALERKLNKNTVYVFTRECNYESDLKPKVFRDLKKAQKYMKFCFDDLIKTTKENGTGIVKAEIEDDMFYFEDSNEYWDSGYITTLKIEE